MSEPDLNATTFCRLDSVAFAVWTVSSAGLSADVLRTFSVVIVLMDFVG